MKTPESDSGPRTVLARTFGVGAVMAALVAAHAATLGGFAVQLAGVRVSARSPLAPALIALSLAVLAAMAAGGRAHAAAVASWVIHSPASARVFAAALAVIATLTGIGSGVDVAGSADASGYVAEARMLASGRLFREEPLALATTPPLGGAVVTPLGFRAVVSQPERQVPTYAPGLPIAMAIAQRVAGTAGPFLVVPVAGGLLVWLVFVLGRQLGSSSGGLAAAAIVASMPVLLFQLLQPMSDVPVAMAWVTAVVCGISGRGMASGLATALAVMIRPNLAPLALPVACLAFAAGDRRRFATRWAAGVAPGVALVAALHTIWYGAPWRSGYGSAGELFSAANVIPNVSLYATWLIGSAPSAALLLVAAFAAVLASGSFVARVIVSMGVLNIALYLPYATFESWHYLRFMLPALCLLLPVGAAFVARHTRRPTIGAALAAGVLLLAVWQLRIADELEVFRLRATERRYALAATWVADHSQPSAVIVTAQQSGNIALNAERSVLRWDLLQPGTLDTAIDLVQASGRQAWLLVEAWEQPLLRERHGGRYGALDWPPAASISTTVPVALYRPGDRAAFLTGSNIATSYVTDRAGGVR